MLKGKNYGTKIARTTVEEASVCLSFGLRQ